MYNHSASGTYTMVMHQKFNTDAEPNDRRGSSQQVKASHPRRLIGRPGSSPIAPARPISAGPLVQLYYFAMLIGVRTSGSGLPYLVAHVTVLTAAAGRATLTRRPETAALTAQLAPRAPPRHPPGWQRARLTPLIPRL